MVSHFPPSAKFFTRWLFLNGVFVTSLGTYAKMSFIFELSSLVQKYPNSSLYRMLRNIDDKGRYVVNGNKKLFQFVLNYLRRGSLELPGDFKSHDSLMEYAIIYDIPPLVKEIRQIKQQQQLQQIEQQ